MSKYITCKVLVCIGAADPIIPTAQRDAFIKEMTDGGANRQMQLYGGVGHSFTNREVDARNLPGFKYDAVTDQRTWQSMRDFFDEVLGPVRA